MPKHPDLQIARARALRRDASEAEQRLWQRLRNRQIEGLKFRRQHEIGPFIADLVCDEAKLIVEADGGQHAEQAVADAHRTAWLEAQGYRVLRFWNHEILQDTDDVLERIRSVALERAGRIAPHPNPLPPGERG
jgi:very-short-patch-repair endonuclease